MRLTIASTIAVTAVLLAPAAASAATGLDPVRISGSTSTGTLDQASVPVTLALNVRDKAGLRQAAAAGGGLTPAQFNSRFAPAASDVSAVSSWAQANGLHVGTGQALSGIAEGDVSQAQSDLVTFEDQNSLPHVNWHQINVGPASTDTAGADEWDLDTQYSTGMAPGVTDLNVYVGTSLSNDDILSAITRRVTDDATKQASFSAGECEVLAFATGFTEVHDVVGPGAHSARPQRCTVGL